MVIVSLNCVHYIITLGYGLAELGENPRDMTADTMTLVGPITKSMVSLLLAKLLDEHQR